MLKQARAARAWSSSAARGASSIGYARARQLRASAGLGGAAISIKRRVLSTISVALVLVVSRLSRRAEMAKLSKKPSPTAAADDAAAEAPAAAAAVVLEEEEDTASSEQVRIQPLAHLVISLSLSLSVSVSSLCVGGIVFCPRFLSHTLAH